MKKIENSEFDQNKNIDNKEDIQNGLFNEEISTNIHEYNNFTYERDL